MEAALAVGEVEAMGEVAAMALSAVVVTLTVVMPTREAVVTLMEAATTRIITAILAALNPLDTEISGELASGVLATIGVVPTSILLAACLH
jgi:hypothetical protein